MKKINKDFYLRCKKLNISIEYTKYNVISICNFFC